MTQFRSAMLGCGPRAHRHGEGFAHVKSITLDAAADLDQTRLDKFCDRFHVRHRYTDLETMLREVRPDIVHCVTQPAFRVQPVRMCAAHGVKAIIVEKPMAANLADAREIARIAAETGIEVIVNTQRRYFKSWQTICELVRSGLAGKVRFIRVYSNPPISCIGSHVIDMVQSLLGDPAPESIWAAAAGAEDFHSNHPGPAHVMASIIYPERVGVMLEQSKHAIGVPGTLDFWFSTGMDIITDSGHISWTESNGARWQFDGMSSPETIVTDFSMEDATGQGAFTEAIATWLNDANVPHGNRLETALQVYQIVVTILQSAVQGQRIAYDPDSLTDPFESLRTKLIAVEGDHPDRVDWNTCRDKMAQ